MRLIQSIDSQVRICNEIIDFFTAQAKTGRIHLIEWDDHLMFLEDERDRLIYEKTKILDGTHEMYPQKAVS